MIDVNSTAYDPRGNKNFTLTETRNVKLNTHTANVSVYKNKGWAIFYVEWKAWEDVWGESFIAWHSGCMPETDREFSVLLDAFLLSYNAVKSKEAFYTENELEMLATFRKLVDKEREKAAEDAVERFQETLED